MKEIQQGNLLPTQNQILGPVSLEVPPLKLKEGRLIDFMVKRVIWWIVAITLLITVVAALG